MDRDVLNYKRSHKFLRMIDIYKKKPEEISHHNQADSEAKIKSNQQVDSFACLFTA